MQITQADYRTVRIAVDGVVILVRYSLYPDGEERLPESITCRGDQVTAYFLTSTIRDFFAPCAGGFSIHRRWSLLQEVGLSFCLDFPGLTGASYLVPGVARGEEAPRRGEPADGGLTALPDALYLLAAARSVAVFTDPQRREAGQGSVELTRLVLDEEPLLRVEVCFPARGLPGAEPVKQGRGARRAAGGGSAQERDARLHVLVAPAAQVFQRTLAAALARFEELEPAPAMPAKKELQERTAGDLRGCLQTLLVREGGVCGLRRAPGGGPLSTTAGAGLASVLARVYPGDPAMTELALELADFSLKGQLPSGLFHENYHLPQGSWLEVVGRKRSAPVIQAEETAAVACSLLELVGLLRRRGLPYARYLHAAERATGALSAPEAPESSWLVLPAPLAALFLLTGKDLYKKTLTAIKERHFAGDSPPGTGPAASSAHDVLLAARAAGVLAGLGYSLKGLDACFNALLPWIYLNRASGFPGSPGAAGGLLEALGANRLLFRGFELSYLLAQLDALSGSRLLAGLKGLLPRLLAFSLQQPAGTSCWPLAGPAAGPLDARLLVRELDFRLKLLEEFPELLRRGK